MSDSSNRGAAGREPDERAAAELDPLAHVPDDLLSRLVAAHGLCLGEITHGDPPMWTGEDKPDRELATRLCAGCPVRRECLEFELRTGGEESAGVWGGLSEDDRRALHQVWRARRARREEKGGERDR
jgi:WhiB family redox-sensing transcriptional regulator